MTEQSSNLENYSFQSRLEDLNLTIQRTIARKSSSDDINSFVLRFSEVFDAFNNALKLFTSRLSSLISCMMINNTSKQGSVFVTRIT